MYKQQEQNQQLVTHRYMLISFDTAANFIQIFNFILWVYLKLCSLFGQEKLDSVSGRCCGFIFKSVAGCSQYCNTRIRVTADQVPAEILDHTRARCGQCYYPTFALFSA